MMNGLQIGLAYAMSVVFLAIGVRMVLAPRPASATFGIVVDDPSGQAFMRATGARNIALSLTAATLIALADSRGLAALFFAGSITAGIDFWIVAGRVGFGGAAKHLGYVAVLLGFGIWIGLSKGAFGNG